MAENIVKTKSYAFALRIVNLCLDLQERKREYVLSKQLIRSGTAIGALVREAEHAESKPDFIHKMSIALKEANETAYWLELLRDANLLTGAEFEQVHNESIEILRILTAIVNSAKKRPDHRQALPKPGTKG